MKRQALIRLYNKLTLQQGCRSRALHDMFPIKWVMALHQEICPTKKRLIEMEVTINYRNVVAKELKNLIAPVIVN